MSTAVTQSRTEELLEVLILEIRGLRADLAGPARGPRDDADVQLLEAIAVAVGDRTFGAAELLEHARAVDTDLARALSAADVESPRVLGKWLRRLEGRAVGSGWLRRTGTDRNGIIWRIVRVSRV